VFNVPGIKIAGKTVRFDRIGKGYQKVKANTALGTPEAISYAKKLPGKTGGILSRVRTLGNAEYEHFHSSVRAAAKGLSRSERREIGKHILQGTDTSTLPTKIREAV